jgi:hypothetical protein
MLTAVEFNNQVLRDAAEIGKVGTNPVLSAGFESATALGSEVRPVKALNSSVTDVLETIGQLQSHEHSVNGTSKPPQGALRLKAGSELYVCRRPLLVRV